MVVSGIRLSHNSILAEQPQDWWTAVGNVTLTHEAVALKKTQVIIRQHTYLF